MLNNQKLILSDLHYLPSIPYLSKFLSHPQILLEQHENYRKRSFRNRTLIATANGVLRLSVPLEKGKNEQLNIRKVRISYEENWPQRHWTAIQSAYGKAPYFVYYADDIRPLLEAKPTFLFELNLSILDTLFQILDLRPNVQLTQAYLPETPVGMVDFRNRITPQNYADYRDENYRAVPYPQVFMEKTGYLPNLSILDLIFCQGPEAVVHLEKCLTPPK